LGGLIERENNTTLNKILNKKRLQTVLLLIILVGLNACVEEFNPVIRSNSNSFLVVDGLISNKPGPYEVKLSLSSPIQSPQFIPYSNAEVTLIEKDGNTETLTETEPGVYHTAENGMQGEIGKKYKIIITTADDEIYESEYQLLREPVGIEKVYAESQINQTEDDYNPDYGVQFFVDTELAKSDTNFLLWRLYGEYKYETDFKTWFVYENHQLSAFSNSDSIHVCYVKDNISSLFTMSTEDLAKPKIDRLPLNFVYTSSRKLSIRYSLLVKQMTLDRESFIFYSELKDIIAQQESLYAEQPYQIRGNVFNINQPDEVVLGYFLVAGETEKRIFIDRPTELLFHYDICSLTEPDFQAYGFLYLSTEEEWPLYITMNENYARALPNQDCVDCRRTGGTIVKPDFWED
jgi:hypothetical protein